MSANEMAMVVYFIRTNFRPEEWTEKTQVLIRYMTDLESSMLYHWMTHGPDSTLNLICERDTGNNDGREGFKMGQFLENFYKARGYGCYGKAEKYPTIGYVWELNFSLKP